MDTKADNDRSAGCSRSSTDEREDDAGEDSEDDDLQLHGVTNPGYSITLELPAPGSLDIQETADNTDVMSCLREASKMVSSNFLSKVTRWLEVRHDHLVVSLVLDLWQQIVVQFGYKL